MGCKTTKTWLREACAMSAVLTMFSLVGCGGPAGVKPDSKLMDDAAPKAGRVVQAGDVADVSYLCKLKTGEVVASTDAVGDNQSKSSLYVQSAKSGPVPVDAGAPYPELPPRREVPLEHEIKYRLADAVVGMKEGEGRRAEVAAEDIPARDEQNYVLHLSRVRKRPKEMTIPVDEFQGRTGRKAEVGQAVVLDPAFPGKVESVTDKDVIIRFSAKPGAVVQTAFGPGTIRETEKGFEIAIDARVGTLVRMSTLVGRITAVDDELITVDYRNPFGREPLICDITVEKVEDKKATEVKKIMQNAEEKTAK